MYNSSPPYFPHLSMHIHLTAIVRFVHVFLIIVTPHIQCSKGIPNYFCMWVYVCTCTVCACLPCWDHLQTLRCSVGPKEEPPADPRSHNSLQLRCEGLCPTQGTQRHLKPRVSSHDQRDIIDSGKTFISSEFLITIHIYCICSCFQSHRKAE